MFVLDYSIANVSIPYISGAWQLLYEGTYVITSFAVGNAIALPITGWLTKESRCQIDLHFADFFYHFSWTCGSAHQF